MGRDSGAARLSALKVEKNYCNPKAVRTFFYFCTTFYPRLEAALVADCAENSQQKQQTTDFQFIKKQSSLQNQDAICLIV
jgi:hypothetical protein